ncbi:YciI family protein [Humibacter sp. RRB41]|uniref:YciI family protein n=1 Tax=Humibacter sp. RRB41 TaxID=2919946 RepID=UPI001FAA279F|nr:transcription initiation protein [Humibacter sp. RRB41]
MTNYLISFPSGVMELSEEDFQLVADEAHAVVRAAKEAGVLVFAGGIDEEVPPFLVFADGVVSDEVYPQPTRLNGGFCVLDLSSREEAVEWAARTAKACRCAQEVRQFQHDPEQ